MRPRLGLPVVASQEVEGRARRSMRDCFHVVSSSLSHAASSAPVCADTLTCPSKRVSSATVICSSSCTALAISESDGTRDVRWGERGEFRHRVLPRLWPGAEARVVGQRECEDAAVGERHRHSRRHRLRETGREFGARTHHDSAEKRLHIGACSRSDANCAGITV